MRVKPDDHWGWLLAHNRKSGLALSYAWERSAFPWLMTWEENHARQEKPWGGRTLTRGLEISSYAFALGRKANVEMGTLFDTPTYAWLDAHEEQSTCFYFSLQQVSASALTPQSESSAEPLELAPRDSDGGGTSKETAVAAQDEVRPPTELACTVPGAMQPIVLW